MLPDFICIGAQKSGTTWLHRQMAEHPEIYVPPGKELDFFFSDRPLEWYEHQFDGARHGQRSGDISPNYMPREEIPEAMARVVPDARLICMLRDPADRAYSQWKMARDRGNIPASLSFQDAFASDARFIRTRGHYAMLLRRFERYYPPGTRLRVFFFEEMVQRPRDLLREVFGFLGVNPDFLPSGVHEVVHGARTPERLGRAERSRIIGHYLDDICELESRFGRDLADWKH